MSARRTWRRAGATLLGALALLLVGAGCGPTMGDLPLPGSGVAGDTIEVTIPFDDALNLARGAPVKVNGVTAGRVREVTTEDFTALVVLEIRTDARVRSTARARLRYTTPLGELFVEVDNPDRGALLRDGDRLDARRASTAPTVEDTLASASLLVNGGGLGQLQTVTEELNDALGGREGTVREVLARSRDLTAAANGATGDLTRALDSLARLSRTVRENDRTVDAALRDLRPAAAVLRRETPTFTRLLGSVERFAGTADRVVSRIRSDLLTMLEEISPVLTEFLANRDTLGDSLRALSAASIALDGIFPGDYWNLMARLDLGGRSLPDLLGSPTRSNPTPPDGGGGTSSGPADEPLDEPLDGLLDGLLGGLTSDPGGRR